MGTIIGILVLQPLMDSKFPAGAFIFPLALVILTLVVGVLLQPDTKGKALLDTIEEADYTRVENSLPLALLKFVLHFLHRISLLFRLAAMHKVMQSELHQKLSEEKRDEWAQRIHQLEVKEEEERRASMLSAGSHNATAPPFVDVFTPQRRDT